MGDLEKILSDDGLAERLTCRIRLGIAIGVAKALYYMHDNPGNPIIHRDVKASNIMLTENFVAKVIRFLIGTWWLSMTHPKNRWTCVNCNISFILLSFWAIFTFILKY